ncbi:hypothetical protein OXX80_009208 [Metschnikowia pulcherrima]
MASPHHKRQIPNHTQDPQNFFKIPTRMKVNIVIRFSDANSGASEHSDLDIPLSINFKRDDVNRLVNASWLKLMIRNQVAPTQRKRLRLIYNGRILNDETNIKEEVFEPKLRQMRALPEPEESLKIYVHCLIGDEMTQAQLEQEKELDRKAQGSVTDPPVIGFDRLLSQGMSASDVDDLRRQFQQIYFPEGMTNGNSNGVADIEEDENRQQFIRELEERWLESTNGSGNNNSRPSSRAPEDTEMGGGRGNLAERAAAELEGTHHNENLLVGLLLGTFLGVVALIFLLVDDSSFNDAQKMAMVLGIGINVFIAFLRVGSEYSP